MAWKDVFFMMSADIYKIDKTSDRPQVSSFRLFIDP